MPRPFTVLRYPVVPASDLQPAQPSWGCGFCLDPAPIGQIQRSVRASGHQRRRPPSLKNTSGASDHQTPAAIANARRAGKPGRPRPAATNLGGLIRITGCDDLLPHDHNKKKYPRIEH